jgi:DNA excision repair protein ERCC-4
VKGERGQVPKRLIVDIREFVSQLPAVLYPAGFQLVPMTLEVADYVLTPHCCVERKAVPDLIESLKSVRVAERGRRGV